MATPRPVKNKDGVVYAYNLRVFRGKGIKDFSKTVRIPEELNGKSQKAIEKWVTAQMVLFEQDCKRGLIPTEKKTFREYADYFLTLKKRDSKQSTVDYYTDLLERVNAEIGYMKLTDIRPEHLNRFYLKLEEPGQNKKTGKGLSPKTILEHHRVIHAILETAVDEGLVQSNVADKAKPPKPIKHEIESFEPEEVFTICEHLNNEPLKWRCIVYTMIYTGARRGEVMGLKWDAIDLEHGVIDIRNNLVYSPKVGVYDESPKTGRNRPIAVDQIVIDLLKQLRQEQRVEFLKLGLPWSNNGYCFTQNGSIKPMHPEDPTKWLTKFSEKNNLPHIHPHKFRHTHVSILLSSGASVVDVAKRVGHGRPSTTADIYAHVLEKADTTIRDTFSSAVKIS